MGSYTLKVEKVTRLFGRRLIFRDIDFGFNSNGVYGISGPNGSGKSTFVKIIAGILSPSSGKVVHQLDGNQIPLARLHDHIGFAAPYLVLYDEFTAEENLRHVAKIRGTAYDSDKIDYLLQQFLLYERKDDQIKGYSSGMKQRLKFIFALMHSPELVILDEPTSNLDNYGKEIVYKIITEEAKNRIIIVASNEENDLALCSEIIRLEAFKNKK